jgi:phosphate-selective porin
MDAGDGEGVKVIGYLQPEYRRDFLGTDVLGKSRDKSAFYFNRLRIGVTGNIPYDFSYYAVAELSPTLNGPYICDAFISYNRFAKWAKVSFGQFKNPFGLETGGTACHKLYTVNRSTVANNLATPIRDFGLLISGGTDSLSIFGSRTQNLFGYQFAVLNGTGLNVIDNNRMKDVVARVTFHPLDFITLGASYRFGKHPPLDATAKEDDQRKRLAFDLELKYKNLVVQGELTSGEDIGSYTTGGGCGAPIETHNGSVERRGYMIMGAYMTKWNLQPVIKFENYDPNLKADSLDDQQNTITYGLNYFFNEWTRVQLNYLYNAEESGNVEVKNDALLIQVQVVF